ncbi:LysE family translocator [Pseudomonas parafulva]|uniref:LysE family translocator n=1 Tax=Pseudomonas parafulva TaxID=157782 RepID=UPI000733EDB5|nr:LysE family translocator [Pseudomonas parafulva]KTS98378.1 lysine transporter LysE [Pseudomonas parafulva]
MQAFILIALAHFLALLSPGPDFFLIARTAIASGWRVASGACLGIALGNGAFIVLAFTGVSILQEGSALFDLLQLGGAVYLIYLGIAFVRHAGSSSISPTSGSSAPTWRRNLQMGLLSGLLNPKNALFYASLASLVAGSSTVWKVSYGIWMFCAVLAWDLLVAVGIGHPRVLRRFSSALPLLERLSGLVLLLLGVGLLITPAWR